MRRRHGIPDDDNRPFNVAYAAALQARKGGERRRGPGMQVEAISISHTEVEERSMEAGASYFAISSALSSLLCPLASPALHGSAVLSGYSNIYPQLNGSNQ